MARLLPYGTKVSLCRACGLVFKSTASFDLHREGRGLDRHCRSEADLRAAGWKPDARGRWSSNRFAGAGEVFGDWR